MTFDVREASIADLRNAMADGRVTAVGLLEAYLARIAAYDGYLNSIVVFDPDAHAAAAASDARRAAGATLGPLDGIPYTVRTATRRAVSPWRLAVPRSPTWWLSGIRSSSSACGQQAPY